VKLGDSNHCSVNSGKIKQNTRLDKTIIKADARNYWHSILPQLGIPEACLKNRGGPCPICRTGDDRFRFDNKEGRGTWYCEHHTKPSGDGLELVQLVLGCSFPEALTVVANVLYGTESDAFPKTLFVAQDEPTLTRNLELSKRTWDQSKPVTTNDPVNVYLKSRFLSETPGVRYIESLKHWDGVNERCFPAMLAAVVDPAGNLVCLHQTYLTTVRLEGVSPAGMRTKQKRPADMGKKHQ
jgi:putative DNA primase/helicase